MTTMPEARKHQRMHEGLEAAAAKYEAVYRAQYAKAKRYRVRPYRRTALQNSRSHRTTLYYAWLTHVKHHPHQAGHMLTMFPSLEELRQVHDKLHLEIEGADHGPDAG